MHFLDMFIILDWILAKLSSVPSSQEKQFFSSNAVILPSKYGLLRHPILKDLGTNFISKTSASWSLKLRSVPCNIKPLEQNELIM